MKKLNFKIEDLNVENFQAKTVDETELAGTHPRICESGFRGPCEDTFEPRFCATNPRTDCRTRVQSICNPTNANTDCKTKVSSCPTRSTASCPTRSCDTRNPRDCDTIIRKFCFESRQPRDRFGCP